MENQSNIPLAGRMRPTSLADYVGQREVVANLQRFLIQGLLPSFILWGPPGVGKTTLAGIVAASLGRKFFTLSAVNSGVKEVREVLEQARGSRFFDSVSPILFIDEIHRFNKSQQDSLLGAVEQGVVVLIGATTENPSFELIKPLLSRCNVYTLKPLADNDLLTLLNKAITTDKYLKERHFKIEQTTALLNFAGGDARKLLNIIETLSSATSEQIVVNDQNVTTILQHSTTRYDKGGEEHYDIISAFIKSIRGSDPDAAIYYLARMISGGEEPRFIARRLMISAAEDIGLANPNAMLLANACFDTVHNLGMPEARIPLSELTIYLACSPKSNSAYMAINKAIELVEGDTYRPVPLHLRNAVTPLMKNEGYALGYKYAHDFQENFVQQEFMPQAIQGTTFWTPQENQAEDKLKERMARLWKKE
ncbi:MAG: replication-associated recombination protein A [Mucinivorans sp.]